MLHGYKVGARGDWRIPVADYEAWVAAGAPTKPPTPNGISAETPHPQQKVAES